MYDDLDRVYRMYYYHNLYYLVHLLSPQKFQLKLRYVNITVNAGARVLPVYQFCQADLEPIWEAD